MAIHTCNRPRNGTVVPCGAAMVLEYHTHRILHTGTYAGYFVKQYTHARVHGEYNRMRVYNRQVKVAKVGMYR